jgi:large subunit ribosomal protein L9
MSGAVKMILREDVSGVGKRGDVVEVSAGYARNFLVPRRLALTAVGGAEAQAATMRVKRAVRDAKDREGATEIATRLVAKVIRISARAGDSGHLYGSVSATDIVDAVQAQTGITLERSAIHLDEHIKAIGEHQVQVRPHSEVEFPITVEVAAT